MVLPLLVGMDAGANQYNVKMSTTSTADVVPTPARRGAVVADEKFRSAEDKHD
jgi:hypothetical protein